MQEDRDEWVIRGDDCKEGVSGCNHQIIISVTLAQTSKKQFTLAFVRVNMLV